MFVAIIIAKRVNIVLDMTVPSNTIHRLVTSAANAKAAATTKETVANEPTLEIMYSAGRTGETANAQGVCWLFSKRMIAPMKNNPIAAGSEKIKTVAVFSLQFSGTAKIIIV